MVFNNRPYTFDRVIRLSLTAGLLWGLVWLLGYLSDVLIPFAIALLLAYLINPLVSLVNKRVPHHALAVLISLLIVLIILLGLGWLIIPRILGEIGHMGRVFTGLVNNSDVARKAAEALPPNIWQAVKEIIHREDVQALFRTDGFINLAKAAANKALPGVWGLITGTASFFMGLLGLAFILMYLVFLLIDYKKVQEGWQELIPSSHRGWILAFVRDFDQGMNRYFRGQAIVASILGIFYATGFGLLGLPLGILLGLTIGLMSMVPYLQLFGIPPALLMATVRAIESGNSVWLFLVLTGFVFILAQILQDWVLTPKIMGNVTGLSPAIILLSLSIWGKLLGVLGLIIALPMTVLLIAYYRRFLVGFEHSPSPPPTGTDDSS